MAVFDKISYQLKHKKQKKNLKMIFFIISGDFSMFYQIFHSPQVKRRATIAFKHGIYELLYDLTNNLRPRMLGN